MSKSERFAQDGYLIEKAVFTTAEIEAIKEEAAQLCHREIGGESAEAAMRTALAIHFPHKLSPLIHRTLSHPGIVRVLTEVVSPNVKCNP